VAGDEGHIDGLVGLHLLHRGEVVGEGADEHELRCQNSFLPPREFIFEIANAETKIASQGMLQLRQGHELLIGRAELAAPVRHAAQRDGARQDAALSRLGLDGTAHELLKRVSGGTVDNESSIVGVLVRHACFFHLHGRIREAEEAGELN